MRSITVTGIGDWEFAIEWACNNAGCGVFQRRPDGTWHQFTGTGQAGPFRTPAVFRRYLREHFAVRECRVVETRGWK